MKETVVRLTIFNEAFWDNGLVYSQSIQPLKKFTESQNKCYFEIFAFISLYNIIFSFKKIKEIIKEREKYGKTYIFPIFYLPSRLFYPKWFILPFLFFNTAPYILIFYIVDFLSSKRVFYNLRSYQIALPFAAFYRNRQSLIFDPRSDLLNELVSIGVWQENSISYKVWEKLESYIITRTYKTIFISEKMMHDLLKRNTLAFDSKKYFVIHNPVDFSRFTTGFMESSPNSFLYSGSLGNWNNLETYLDFFLKIQNENPEAVLYVLTSTKLSKLKNVLENPKFAQIIDSVKIEINPPYEEIPLFYAKCRFGLQLMSRKDNRLGVKFVEYIAAGIVPIVNTNVEGACAYLDKVNIGLVVENDFSNVEQLINNLPAIEQLRSNLKRYHNELRKDFDINESYRMYRKVFS